MVSGETPSPLNELDQELFVALRASDLAAARSLLDRGAKADAKHSNGDPAWVWAVLYDDRPMANLLFSRLPEMDRTNGEVALVFAAGSGNEEFAAKLLSKGVDPDCRLPRLDGSTPLLMAASNGHVGIAKLLIDRKADVNRKDPHGDTALMAAVRFGSIPMVELLLAAGAEPSARDFDGRTPLVWAARSGRADMVKLLLDHGVSRNDRAAASALVVAGRRGYPEVVKMLRAGGLKDAAPPMLN